MSMLPEKRQCAYCGRRYSFNPSVGRGLVCPHCGNMNPIGCGSDKAGNKVVDLLRRIFRK